MALLAGACSSSETVSNASMGVGPGPGATTSVVAEARKATVEVLDAPNSSRVTNKLANPQPSGAPLVFLVTDTQPDWLKVLLPVRPNGSTGWVRQADVTTRAHPFRIIVQLGAHRITVMKGQEVFLEEPIGVGTQDTPTPGGLYYTKELLQPPDRNSVYGPFAYGLSGFSNVLTSFAGGDGVIGIHGNNDPSSLGKNVSHGCIRMSNTGITRLAKTLPLGVPVEIRS